MPLILAEGRALRGGRMRPAYCHVVSQSPAQLLPPGTLPGQRCPGTSGQDLQDQSAPRLLEVGEADSCL